MTYYMMNFKKFKVEDIVKKLDNYENCSSLLSPDMFDKNKFGFFDYPKNTMLGFKQIVNKVFSKGYTYEIPFEISILNKTIKINSITLLISTSNDLDAMEEDDLMLVVSSNDENLKELYTSKEHISKSALSKKIKEEFSRLEIINNIFSDIKTDYYDIKIKDIALDVSETKKYNITLAVLSAFYYYAFLLQYRLERLQVATNVADEDDKSFIEFNKKVILQRTFLLNLNRYFLTRNRSVDITIKNFADELIEQFGLRAKMKDRETNIELFDTLIERKISNIQELRGKSIKKALQLVMFLGIPLAFISTFMSFNKKSDFVLDPLVFINDYSVGFVVAISFLLPFVILGIGVAIDYMQSKKE